MALKLEMTRNGHKTVRKYTFKIVCYDNRYAATGIYCFFSEGRSYLQDVISLFWICEEKMQLCVPDVFPPYFYQG